MSFQIHVERFSAIHYQIFFMIITMALLIGMLYKPLREFNPIEHEPKVIALTDAVAEQWHASLQRIKTGFSITDFIKFDTLKNKFVVNAIVWFDFNPKKVSMETVANFSFTKGEILKKSEPSITVLNETTHRAHYYIRVQFAASLNYARFPLDDHRIFLNLTHSTLDAQHIVYEVAPSDFTIASNLYAAGSKVINHGVQSGYTKNAIGSHEIYQPKVLFSLDLSKQDERQLLLILLPLILIFYFAIFAFSIKDVSISVNLVMASISGLLAYSFVIQTLSPVVGYFMISDYLFIFFITSIFIIFVISILFAVPGHIASKFDLSVVRGITIPFLNITLLLVWYYLTNVKDIV